MIKIQIIKLLFVIKRNQWLCAQNTTWINTITIEFTTNLLSTVGKYKPYRPTRLA